MKVTLESIARELGVTKNTVSKALRGMPGVSDTLRGKIIQAADAYGYRRKGRIADIQSPAQITLVCNDRFIKDPIFWAAVLSGVFDYAARNHIGIRTVIVDLVSDDIKYQLALQEKYCDGIIVIGSIPDTLLIRIAALEIPMVVVDHYVDQVECDYVNTANQAGVWKAVRFLARNNHRKIGFINNINRRFAYSFNQRYLGYITGMDSLGLPVDPHFVWPDSDFDDNQYLRDQLDKLLAYGDAPTAWICVNDLTAYNFNTILAERGLRAPEDVSLVGFDKASGLYQPKLTTLEIQQNAMGRRAMEKLMHRISHPDEPFENIEIFTRLIVNESVRML